MENLQTTTPEETLPQLKSVAEVARNILPTLKKGNEMALAAMKEIPDVINTPEELEEATDTSIAVRETYNKMQALRMTATRTIDELKDHLMAFERPLSDKDKDSEYVKLRAKIASYQQKKIDEKKKIEEQAAKKKLRENHLVDITTIILQNLNNLILTKTTEAETKSANYFASATLADFDAKAEEYRKMKPSLKPDEYSKCFNVPYNNELFSVTEIADIISTLKTVETYEKWNQEVIKACTPIVNAWRAKIPELKENLIKLKNAESTAERDRLAAEQKRKAEEEAQRRAAELEQQNLAKSVDIAAQANLSKLENDFKEQIATQELGETGPVKYVLKFTDPKLHLKALTTIIYHVMASPKFEGIEKKKDGKVVVDANNIPVYIAAVQWWVDFFMTHCDADIPGSEVREVSKVIIRK